MIPETFKKHFETATILVGAVAVVLAIAGFVTDPNPFVTSMLPLLAGSTGIIALQVAVAPLVKALREQAEREQRTTAQTRTELISTTHQQKTLTERFEKLNLVSDLLKSIATSKDLNSLLSSILNQTMKFVGARSGFVSLLKEEEGVLEVASAVALHGDPVGFGKIRFGDGIVGIVAASNKPRLISPSAGADWSQQR